MFRNQKCISISCVHLFLLIFVAQSWSPSSFLYSGSFRSGRCLGSTLLFEKRADSVEKNVVRVAAPNIFFIRKSMIGDMGKASKILADGFYKHKNFIVYQLEKLETFLSLESCFPKPNTFHEIFVACDNHNGEVLGLVEVDARRNQTKGRSHQDDPYMYNLAVDEGHKRKGIAKALIREVEEKVQAWHSATDGNIPNSIYLKVRQSNEAAVIMYDQLGYRSYMQEADRKGEVVLVMRKSLHASKQETLESEPAKTPSRK
jgi:ribosomal protein S18 acetylase RimI-like enzyme